MSVQHSPPIDLEEPPASQARVLITGLVGVGLVFAALILGLLTGAPKSGLDPHGSDGARALLAVVGLVVAGAAVSLRPKWYGGWLVYAAAGLLGYGAGTSPAAGTEWYLSPARTWVAAVPNSWDSIQLFFGVAGGLAGLIGAAVSVLPRKVVLVGLLGGVAFHFAGILSAITSPAPSSWLTDQYWKRVSRPYLYFAYLNNAYQFYSPEPGPATQLWICIEYVSPEPDAPVADEEGRPVARRDCEWKVIPRRPDDVRDPLGLSYYRRLSLTENATHVQPTGYQFLQAEWEQVVRRRASATHIAKEQLPDNLQYVNPTQLVSLQVLPSYAQHFARTLANPDKTVKSIKVYRATHAILELYHVRGIVDPATGQLHRTHPYSELLYQVVFLGEFDPAGRLVDPLDPLLYWKIPIRQNVPPPDDEAEFKRKGYRHYFTDYVSIHAGCPRHKE